MCGPRVGGHCLPSGQWLGLGTFGSICTHPLTRFALSFSISCQCSQLNGTKHNKQSAAALEPKSCARSIGITFCSAWLSSPHLRFVRAGTSPQHNLPISIKWKPQKVKVIVREMKIALLRHQPEDPVSQLWKIPRLDWSPTSTL